MAAPRLESSARAASDRLFWGIGRGRGRRAIHPGGLAYRAAFYPLAADGLAGVAELLDAPGPRSARVRFSRGFGFPQPLPELPSLALKVDDAYGPGRDQDFLLSATCGARPVLRHVFRPGRSHLDRFYSSVLPFRLGGKTVLFGATLAGPRTPEADDLDELDAAARRGLTLGLWVASVRGRWVPMGTVAVGARFAEAQEERVSFNPEHLGSGIAPVGLLNAVRGSAYVGSRRGRLGA